MTTWISHRGYTAEATENTAEAFLAAIGHGFDHLETDLRTTRDGHIVLCHDADLRRVSGRQVRMSELTRKELAQEKLPCGERLLFFDDFLEHFSHLNWILDIKPEGAQRTVDILTAMRQDPQVEAFLTQRTRYLFWNAQHEQQLTTKLPEAFCLAREGACYRAGLATLLGASGMGGLQTGQYYALPPKLKGVPILNPTVVQRFHAKNARVIGYLPESEADRQRALTAGVDQLLTNHANLKSLFGH